MIKRGGEGGNEGMKMRNRATTEEGQVRDRGGVGKGRRTSRTVEGTKEGHRKDRGGAEEGQRRDRGGSEEGQRRDSRGMGGWCVCVCGGGEEKRRQSPNSYKLKRPPSNLIC